MIRNLVFLTRTGVRATAGPVRILANHSYVENPVGSSEWRRMSAVFTASRSLHQSSADFAQVTGGEVIKDVSEEHSFQADTRQLLGVVASSLYSNKEVFIRELVSNASDALEKFRILQLTTSELVSQDPLEIHLYTDPSNRKLIIKDSGIGMNREELMENLGIIAKSGTSDFVKSLSSNINMTSAQDIIGKFGVGFYSSFMVADKVEVYTRSIKPGSSGYYWCSDGTGSYRIAEADNVSLGTKIIIHLKNDCVEFSEEMMVRAVLEKHSLYLNFPVYLNGTQVSITEPLWMKDKNNVNHAEHENFFQKLTNSNKPLQYSFMFKTDSPMSINSVLYFPQKIPNMFAQPESAGGIDLYCRKVLVQSKAAVLPEWLKFVRGVVDCEDVPLNLSREFIQDSAVITKLKSILTRKVVTLLQQEAKHDRVRYENYYSTIWPYLFHGTLSTEDDNERGEMMKLLRFETVQNKPGHLVSIQYYIDHMLVNQKEVLYMCCNNRDTAVASPCLESLEKTGFDVLLCYSDPYGYLFTSMRSFSGKRFISVEEYCAGAKVDQVVNKEGALSQAEQNKLSGYFKSVLGYRVESVGFTGQLQNYPAMLIVDPYDKIAKLQNLAEKARDDPTLLMQPSEDFKAKLQLNPNHPLIVNLSKLFEQDEQTARQIIDQVYISARLAAGLQVNQSAVARSLNDFLTKTSSKLTNGSS